MKIRPITVADRLGIYKLLHVASTGVATEIVSGMRSVDSFLFENSLGIHNSIIAEGNNGEVLGYLSFYSDIDTTDIYYINCLVSSPASDNDEIKKQLLQAVEQLLFKSGGKMIIAAVSSQSHHAALKSFLNSSRFVDGCAIENFYGPGVSKLFLTKQMNTNIRSTPS